MSDEIVKRGRDPELDRTETSSGLRKLVTFKNVPLSAAGSLPHGHPVREKVVDNLAAAIMHTFTVANIMVWRNASTGTEHWREDCPSLRRSKWARADLIPARPGMRKPCAMCALMEAGEDARRRIRRVKRGVTTLLSLEGPTSPYINPAYVWTPPVALLPPATLKLEAA